MREPNPEKLASLNPLVEGGKLTAAHASQISDGATAVLVASERALKDHGLTPRARVHHISVLADDPIYMLSAPIPATKRALEKAGMSEERHRRRRDQRGLRLRRARLAEGARLGSRER